MSTLEIAQVQFPRVGIRRCQLFNNTSPWEHFDGSGIFYFSSDITSTSRFYVVQKDRIFLIGNDFLGFRYFPFVRAECRIDFIMVFSPKGSVRFDTYVEIGSPTSGSLLNPLQSPLLQKVTNVINIHISMDSIGGSNLAQCIMSATNTNPISQYLPNVNKYVIGDGCFLSEKTIMIATRDYQPNQALNVLTRLSLYAVLRYYLWQLMKGKFCLGILQDKYTDLFFVTLATSPYADFIELFQSDLLLGYHKYFVYSLE